MPREIVTLGVEPKEIGWGLTLSQEPQEQMPRILDRVKEETGHLAQSSLGGAPTTKADAPRVC